jgi:choline dehydrogenase-like flavoprotein
VIIDARREDVQLNRTVQVAIVGAGPAGMTLARELAKVADVLVIESGGFETDADQQALLEGECAGIKYPLMETRARQFGGSSALWAGYVAVFDRHDFEPREWVPGTSWPFGIDSILPYYDRASELLNLSAPNFDAAEIAGRAGITLPFRREVIASTVWRFGLPTQRFGETFRAEFTVSSRILTLIHANVVDIRLDSSQSKVTGMAIRTLNGREGRISADLFILACGGIETPRILLNSDSQIPSGVGNSSGMVGRCFMEHPHRTVLPLVLANTRSFESWTQRSTYDGDKEFMSCVGLTAQAQEEAQILNARAHIYRTPEMHVDDIPRVGLFMEQAPNPKSRVFLLNSRDALGMRRVCLDWQLTDLDWKTYEMTATALINEFEHVGFAHRCPSIAPAARESEGILHSNHHLGTTRMSERTAGCMTSQTCTSWEAAFSQR